jgi:hypothetical protein
MFPAFKNWFRVNVWNYPNIRFMIVKPVSDATMDAICVDECDRTRDIYISL